MDKHSWGPERRWFVTDRGVPQGSPVSPSLYNMFLDEFAERQSEIPRVVADVPAVLFADDVLLTSETAVGAPEAVRCCDKVGEDRQMMWNVNAGKREVLESEMTKNHTLRLGRTPLTKIADITYLGVSLSSIGVTNSPCPQRQNCSAPIASTGSLYKRHQSRKVDT